MSPKRKQLVAARPEQALRRPLQALELANRRVRLRDVDSDQLHLTDGNKQIDVFTEHVVDVHVTHRHVRLSDDTCTVDVEAVRLHVRDVDRRRARVADPDCVMHVLTERVTVSKVVTSRLNAAHGPLLWHALGSEITSDTSSRERVEFGDRPREEQDPEPVVILPEDELDGAEFVDDLGEARVTFQEIPCDLIEEPGDTLYGSIYSATQQACQDDTSASVPGAEEKSQRTRQGILTSRPDNHLPGSFSKDLAPVRSSRKWSRRNCRTTSDAFQLKQKPARRPPHRHQARARGCSFGGR